MELDLSALPRETERAAKQVLPHLGFSCGRDGVRVLAERTAKALSLSFDGKTLDIKYPAINQFFRALTIFKQKCGAPFAFVQKEFNGELCAMLDCSRNAVRNTTHLKSMIRDLALLGYNMLMLYTEDTYEIDGEPYFGYLRGRYTKSELREIAEYARSFGIEAVPCIQTLAHLNQMFRNHDAYDGIRDIDDILLIDDERTYALIEKMVASCRDAFDTDKIHIGMDEAHMVGRGAYQTEHGFADKYDLLIKHLDRVAVICEKYGFKPRMWSDMFFRLAFGTYYIEKDAAFPNGVAERVPKNVKLVYWDYYHKDEKTYERMINLHRELTDSVSLACGAYRWVGFTPCNGFSLDANKSALDAFEKTGLDDITVTLWGDDGAECSDYAVLPNLVYVAERIYGGEFESAFKTISGTDLSDFMEIDDANILDPAQKRDVHAHNRTRLYNDPFCGLFDRLVKSDESEIYKKHAERLKKVANSAGRFRYVFDTQSALCETLALKCDLGVKTRKLYKAGDKQGLKRLLQTNYYPLAGKIAALSAAFERQWLAENKPFGLEIQNYRLGGLSERIRYCASALEHYIGGEQNNVAELDEELLDFAGGSAMYVFSEMIGANKL